MSWYPSNEAIDRDLALYNYDAGQGSPEYSHEDLRRAWLAGYAEGLSA